MQKAKIQIFSFLVVALATGIFVSLLVLHRSRTSHHDSPLSMDLSSQLQRAKEKYSVAEQAFSDAAAAYASARNEEKESVIEVGQLELEIAEYSMSANAIANERYAENITDTSQRALFASIPLLGSFSIDTCGSGNNGMWGSDCFNECCPYAGIDYVKDAYVGKKQWFYGECYASWEANFKDKVPFEASSVVNCPTKGEACQIGCGQCGKVFNGDNDVCSSGNGQTAQMGMWQVAASTIAIMDVLDLDVEIANQELALISSESALKSTLAEETSLYSRANAILRKTVDTFAGITGTEGGVLSNGTLSCCWGNWTGTEWADTTSPSYMGGCDYSGASICHYDDLAWWALAFTRAAEQFPDDEYHSKYLSQAKNILKGLYNAWTDTADGGYEWNCEGYNKANGQKNVITNVLALLASANLLQIEGTSKSEDLHNATNNDMFTQAADSVDKTWKWLLREGGLVSLVNVDETFSVLVNDNLYFQNGGDACGVGARRSNTKKPSPAVFPSVQQWSYNYGLLVEAAVAIEKLITNDNIPMHLKPLPLPLPQSSLQDLAKTLPEKKNITVGGTLDLLQTFTEIAVNTTISKFRKIPDAKWNRKKWIPEPTYFPFDVPPPVTTPGPVTPTPSPDDSVCSIYVDQINCESHETECIWCGNKGKCEINVSNCEPDCEGIYSMRECDQVPENACTWCMEMNACKPSSYDCGSEAQCHEMFDESSCETYNQGNGCVWCTVQGLCQETYHECDQNQPTPTHLFCDRYSGAKDGQFCIENGCAWCSKTKTCIVAQGGDCDDDESTDICTRQEDAKTCSYTNSCFWCAEKNLCVGSKLGCLQEAKSSRHLTEFCGLETTEKECNETAGCAWCPDSTSPSGICQVSDLTCDSTKLCEAPGLIDNEYDCLMNNCGWCKESYSGHPSLTGYCDRPDRCPSSNNSEKDNKDAPASGNPNFDVDVSEQDLAPIPTPLNDDPDVNTKQYGAILSEITCDVDPIPSVDSDRCNYDQILFKGITAMSLGRYLRHSDRKMKVKLSNKNLRGGEGNMKMTRSDVAVICAEFLQESASYIWEEARNDRSGSTPTFQTQWIQDRSACSPGCPLYPSLTSANDPACVGCSAIDLESIAGRRTETGQFEVLSQASSLMLLTAAARDEFSRASLQSRRGTTNLL
eukprot:g2585.t1